MRQSGDVNTPSPLMPCPHGDDGPDINMHDRRERAHVPGGRTGIEGNVPYVSRPAIVMARRFSRGRSPLDSVDPKFPNHPQSMINNV